MGKILVSNEDLRKVYKFLGAPCMRGFYVDNSLKVVSKFHNHCLFMRV